MIHVQGAGPIENQTLRAVIPVATGVEDPSRRLGRIAPLIHELVAWDLVYRSEGGAFLLRDDVQQRLYEMSAVAAAPTAQVFVGRKCEVCGLVRVTRIVDGSRVCGVCSKPAVTPPAMPLEQSEGGGQRGTRSRWHRKAS